MEIRPMSLKPSPDALFDILSISHPGFRNSNLLGESLKKKASKSIFD
jgi:hypothetical protein